YSDTQAPPFRLNRRNRKPESRIPWSVLIIGFIVVTLVIHILLGIVVYRDLARETVSMSVLWVLIVLLGGLFTAVLYVMFRYIRLYELQEVSR
ncbi:MAG: hypothetical protein ABEJ65_04015, partial [bacterium]